MLALLALFAWAGAAGAHTTLKGSTPAQGARLETAPARVELRFSEPVRPVVARVRDATGRVVSLARGVSASGRAVRIELEAALGNGEYLVDFRVVSRDAHAVSGALRFAVGPEPDPRTAPAPVALAPPQAPVDPWLAPLALNRLLHIAALAAAAGGLLYLWLVARGASRAHRPLRPALVLAALIGGLSAIAGVGIQGASIAQASVAGLLGAEVWRLGAESTRGTAFGIAFASLACIALGALSARGRAAVFLYAAGVAGVLGSFVVSGHIATLEPQSTLVPLWLVHVTAAMFWIGSMLPLSRAARAPASEALNAMLGFSAVAGVAVPLMLLAGGVMAAIQLEQPAALLGSRYGNLVLAKAVLVSGMLAIALYNRFDLTPRLARGEHSVRSALRVTLGIEWLLGLCILALAAWLSQTPPPAPP